MHVNDLGVQGLSPWILTPEQQKTKLQEYMHKMRAEEVFYLQTCNRVEFLFSSSQPLACQNFLQDSKIHLPTERVFEKLEDITEHLLGVAVSRDSLVFGENQILGQFKSAYQFCLQEKLLSKKLNLLLKWVLQEAKSIRTQISFGALPTSLSAVAAREVLNAFSSQSSILFIGAGETNQLVARYLIKRKFTNFIWVNRSHEKAEASARELGGLAKTWSDLQQNPVSADVICLATNSVETLLPFTELKAIAPRVVLDLSVPANVKESDCKKLEITYRGISDLSATLEQQRNRYNSLIHDLDLKIQDAKIRVMQQVNLAVAAPLLKAIVEQNHDLVADSLERLFSSMPGLDKEQKGEIESWSQKLLQNLSHQQLTQMKEVLKNHGHSNWIAGK